MKAKAPVWAKLNVDTNRQLKGKRVQLVTALSI